MLAPIVCALESLYFFSLAIPVLFSIILLKSWLSCSLLKNSLRFWFISSSINFMLSKTNWLVLPFLTRLLLGNLLLFLLAAFFLENDTFLFSCGTLYLNSFKFKGGRLASLIFLFTLGVKYLLIFFPLPKINLPVFVPSNFGPLLRCSVFIILS